jgi:hypothetical protein
MSKIQAFVFLAALASSTEVLADLSVERAVWTTAVDRSTRAYGPVCTSPVKDGTKVMLWTELRASADLLDQMKGRDKGFMPIRHNWYRYDADSIYPDEASVSLELGRKEDLPKLSHQVNTEGSFTWRVWSTRDRVSRGMWRVDVVWENGDPLVCPDQNGPDSPCRFFIEVK